MEKTLAYFVTNVGKIKRETFEKRTSPHSGIVQTIVVDAYLMVIFPPGVHCSSRPKFWVIELYRDTIGLPVTTIELHGVPPDVKPYLRGEYATKDLVLGDYSFQVEGGSNSILLEQITGEDTIDWSDFIENFLAERKLPGRIIKTRMLGWQETGKIDEFL